MILALEEFKMTQDQKDYNRYLQHTETFEKLRVEWSKPEHKLSQIQGKKTLEEDSWIQKGIRTACEHA